MNRKAKLLYARSIKKEAKDYANIQVHKITDRGTFIVEHETGQCEEIQEAWRIVFIEPDPDAKAPISCSSQLLWELGKPSKSIITDGAIKCANDKLRNLKDE